MVLFEDNKADTRHTRQRWGYPKAVRAHLVKDCVCLYMDLSTVISYDTSRPLLLPLVSSQNSTITVPGWCCSLLERVFLILQLNANSQRYHLRSRTVIYLT